MSRSSATGYLQIFGASIALGIISGAAEATMYGSGYNISGPAMYEQPYLSITCIALSAPNPKTRSSSPLFHCSYRLSCFPNPDSCAADRNGSTLCSKDLATKRCPALAQ
jgi:hypothetical protein